MAEKRDRRFMPGETKKQFEERCERIMRGFDKCFEEMEKQKRELEEAARREVKS